MGSAAGANCSASVAPPARSWRIWVADWAVNESGPVKNEFTAKGAAAAAVSVAPVAARSSVRARAAP